MRPFRYLLPALTLTFLVAGNIQSQSTATEAATNQTVSSAPTGAYCDLLGHSEKFKNQMVWVQAIYETDFEKSVITSPSCPTLLPMTWVTFDGHWESRTTCSVWITVSEPKWRVPLNVVFIGKFKTEGRYGHMDMYPLSIEVYKVEAATTSKNAALSPKSLAQTTDDAGYQRTPPVFSRQYRDGEKLGYHMEATNEGRYKTIKYQADVDCVVKRDARGTFVEECSWTNLIVDNSRIELSAAAKNFRQALSLEPAIMPTVPDLSKVLQLVGPITDLLTFYIDLWLANKSNQLQNVGDRFYIPHGIPNSWADGNYVLTGEDSIDFDFVFAGKTAQGIATIVVRHVPPAQPQIKLPAEWMKAQVADTPNNWVEVEKSGDGKFSAEVGKETFDVELRVAKDGKLLSATMDNPVDVFGQDCTDRGLTHCEDRRAALPN